MSITTHPLPDSRLKILSSYEEMMGMVRTYLTRQAAGRQIDILEAGCGRRWEFTSLNVGYRLTGVDMDRHALESRVREDRDLDAAVVGDLRTVALPDSRFDVIYSSYVLEHIPNAERVLKNFVSWLRPGGLLIIKIPDRDSVFRILTRITPYWFHVLYHRYAKGEQLAGMPGHGPYPTIYDKILARKSLVEFAKKNHLEIREECGYDNDVSSSWRRLFELIRLLSFGALYASHADVIYIFQKA